jgi:hypothetical protein
MAATITSERGVTCCLETSAPEIDVRTKCKGYAIPVEVQMVVRRRDSYLFSHFLSALRAEGTHFC